jgi:hypothetical protein
MRKESLLFILICPMTFLARLTSLYGKYIFCLSFSGANFTFGEIQFFFIIFYESDFCFGILFDFQWFSFNVLATSSIRKVSPEGEYLPQLLETSTTSTIKVGRLYSFS